MPPPTRPSLSRASSGAAAEGSVRGSGAPRSEPSPATAREGSWLPARPGVLGAYYLSRALLAVMVSLPLSASVAHVIGRQPRGDAVLWDSGGILLFETSRLLEPALTGLGWSTALLGLAASFALLVPLAALIAAMGPGGDDGRAWTARRLLARAADRFGTLSLLMGVIMLMQALAFALWTLLAGTVIRSLDLQPASRDLGWLGTLALGALVPWFIGIAHDVSRVGAVQQDLGLLDSLGLALRVLGRAARRAVVAAGWRGLCAAAALLGAGCAGVAMGCQSPARLGAVLLVHQLALVAAVLLRASWLRWVTERVGEEAAVVVSELSANGESEPHPPVSGT